METKEKSQINGNIKKRKQEKVFTQKLAGKWTYNAAMMSMQMPIVVILPLSLKSLIFIVLKIKKFLENWGLQHGALALCLTK